MLQTLYRLGHSQEQKPDDLVSSLTDVRHIIALVFENNDGVIKYDRSELLHYDDPSRYLYRSVKSGKPGLFLTGSIPQDSIKKINLTGDNNAVFISNKILWF